MVCVTPGPMSPRSQVVSSPRLQETCSGRTSNASISSPVGESILRPQKESFAWLASMAAGLLTLKVSVSGPELDSVVADASSSRPRSTGAGSTFTSQAQTRSPLPPPSS